MNKILITNTGLGSYYGTETWTYAMAKELSKRFDVSVYSPYLGKMADKIAEFCRVVCSIGNYDLAIVNHINCYNEIPDNIFKIFTSHSKIHRLEIPPVNAKYVVGVNEYIYKNVIRNGIDTERFKPTKINKVLKNILYLSNPSYAGGKEMMKKAAEGYNLIIIDEERFDVENLIAKADLVVSLGRGALESMACGKNIIYGDFRSDWMNDFRGGGLITPENYNDFKIGEWHKNREVITIKKLKEEFRKYKYEYGIFNRAKILKDFNIINTAQQYIDIWKTHINKNI